MGGFSCLHVYIWCQNRVTIRHLCLNVSKVRKCIILLDKCVSKKDEKLWHLKIIKKKKKKTQSTREVCAVRLVYDVKKGLCYTKETNKEKLQPS